MCLPGKKSLKRIVLSCTGNRLCSVVLPPVAGEASAVPLQLLVAGTVEKERRGAERGGTWPPSDPEMMLSASSDKAEITYCSVWAVGIVSASGVTEGSKENPSIWCFISPYPPTSPCFYLLISLRLFFFLECTLCVHFSAGLCWVLFCRVCLAMH